MTIKKRVLNRPRRDRVAYPPRPEFSWAAIVVGFFVSDAVAILVQIARRHAHLWITIASVFGGAALGALFEAGRYRWRLRQWHRTCTELQAKHVPI